MHLLLRLSYWLLLHHTILHTRMAINCNCSINYFGLVAAYPEFQVLEMNTEGRLLPFIPHLHTSRRHLSL